MAADIHIMPVRDMREHQEHRECWCHPQCLVEEDTVFVVHYCMDGRELIEQHGVQ